MTQFVSSTFQSNFLFGSQSLQSVRFLNRNARRPKRVLFFNYCMYNFVFYRVNFTMYRYRQITVKDLSVMLEDGRREVN